MPKFIPQNNFIGMYQFLFRFFCSWPSSALKNSGRALFVFFFSWSFGGLIRGSFVALTLATFARTRPREVFRFVEDGWYITICPETITEIICFNFQGYVNGGFQTVVRVSVQRSNSAT